MTTPYLGSLMIFAGNFAPRGYALCNGQIMSIAQNTALFSILGTTYGGDGISTFGLPNLQGRVPIHTGSNGQSSFVLGQTGGSETVTLSPENLPAHTHAVNAVATNGSTDSPSGALPAIGSKPDYYSSAAANTTMSPLMIAATGAGEPATILQPYLTLVYVIALQGVFPSRN